MDVISVEGFIDIDIDIFCVVLERDIFSIWESWFFGVVVCWVEVEC